MKTILPYFGSLFLLLCSISLGCKCVGKTCHSRTSGNESSNNTTIPLNHSTAMNNNSHEIGDLGTASRRSMEMLRPIIIYRTKADYSQLVPITLSEDGQQVVSYPAPTDLMRGQDYTLPTPLADGWLLDNRGITPHSVFIRLSYAEYGALERSPSTEELLQLVVDPNPFVSIVLCDRQQIDDPTPKKLNRYITEGMPGAIILL